MSTEQDLAGRAVEMVSGRLSGAEVAAEADRNQLGLTRFATSVIHQNVAEDVTRVRLTVHHDGRTAAATGTVSRRRWPRGPRRSRGRLRRDRPRRPGLARAHRSRPGHADVPALDPATAEATPADRAEIVRGFVEGAGGLETAGYCRTNHWHGAFASSSGHAVTGEAAECGVSAIARDHGPDGPADGVARLMPLRLLDIDGFALGARAAAKARAWSQPVELPPGHYEVVLEPDAVLDVIGHVGSLTMNGKAVNDGISYAELGADQHDRSVTLYDDAARSRARLRPRGHAASSADAGRLGTHRGDHPRPSHGRRGGHQSTGHAVVDRFGMGPMARHLGLEPSSSDSSAAEAEGPMADSSVAALVAGVRRGILVSDFWYTRVLDPRTLSLTGLTRNGVWLVEDGEVTSPVKNFRFTQSYAQALAPGNVLGIGRTATPIPGDTYAATSPRYTCPALHLASWNFTGGASG